MGFIDEAVITIKSGDGGGGCISFRRQRFIPKGGPDGGDGGDGGSIIVKASRKHCTLEDYSTRKYFKAPNGEYGKSKDQTGRNGRDLRLRVPCGTVVQDHETGEVLADLTQEDQEVVLVTGGRGGKGNKYFASPKNRAPRIAQPGLPGQEKRLLLTLKFLADIGLVGLPNTGKSTLLSRLTLARPKVNSYPFTTIFPNLGVLTLEAQPPLVVADIPGLIRGASQGRGLGLRFLKHIERTQLLLHLIDITYEPTQGCLEDLHIIRDEMAAYNPALLEKPQLVLINKIDLYDPTKRNLDEVLRALKKMGLKALTVSALSGEGLEGLKRAIICYFPPSSAIGRYGENQLTCLGTNVRQR